MIGAVVPIAAKVAGGITLTKSPRYGGGDGPLYSTVNGMADRIATGDLAVIRQLDGLRKTDADKEQWQKFWDEMVPLQPLTEQQVALIKQLDPTKTGLTAHGGEAVHAQPGVTPPTLEQVLRGLAHVVEASDQTVRSAPAGNPLSAVRASTGGLPLWAVVALAGGLGYVVFKLVKKG